MENGFGRQNDVDPRSKFDKADALTTRYMVAFAGHEYDATCEQAGDLLESHFESLALNGHDVLFIAVG
jgi:hypothetical protein